jgi:hypothetical protein
MGHKVLLTLALACIAVAAPGCRPPAATPAGAEEQRATVRVENRASLDMNIYLLRGAERIRLGTASALSTQRFRIPPGVIFGPTTLRFLADPIGSTRTPISDEIIVNPGDEVVLTIPPE